jgi:hypothetical protein
VRIDTREDLAVQFQHKPQHATAPGFCEPKVMVTFLRLGEFFDEPRRKREFAIPALIPAARFSRTGTEILSGGFLAELANAHLT